MDATVLREDNLSSESGKFISHGKEVEIILTETSIQWKFKNSETQKKLQAKNRTVDWRDVVGMDRKPTLNKPDAGTIYLTLSYIDKGKDYKWTCKNITFEGYFSSWITIIEERIGKDKPKRLLAIINPIGGFGKGRQIYEKKVAPLFAIADIHVEVIVTERALHATDIAKTHDLTNIDGLVVVGGDGLYHEVINGLLIRTQEENTIDYNDTECQLKSPWIPIGIIPAGTGNGLAEACCFCIDVETSVLHIIRGEHHKAGVLSVNVAGKHAIFGGLFFSYGILSSIFKKTESRQWMRMIRNGFTFIGGMLSRYHISKGEVTYKTKPASSITENGAENNESDWKRLDLDEILAVTTFIGDLDLSSDQLRINAQSSVSHVMAYPRVKKIEHLKHWKRFALREKTTFEFDWLKYERLVTRIHIKVDQSKEGRTDYTQEDRDSELFIIVDGESVAIGEPEVDVRFCPQLVSMYSEKFGNFTQVEK